ncbi:hypothetical protein VPH35_055962 [Triticum aestivum]|uniref:Uncharacterized protein n=1 Tax=Triticum aestivum TaxID=4565 RepID=A0A077RZH1_WHEAT|nr:unnamed protein product [Triticum aestivum]
MAGEDLALVEAPRIRQSIPCFPSTRPPAKALERVEARMCCLAATWPELMEMGEVGGHVEWRSAVQHGAGGTSSVAPPKLPGEFSSPPVHHGLPHDPLCVATPDRHGVLPRDPEGHGPGRWGVVAKDGVNAEVGADWLCLALPLLILMFFFTVIAYIEMSDDSDPARWRRISGTNAREEEMPWCLSTYGRSPSTTAGSSGHKGESKNAYYALRKEFRSIFESVEASGQTGAVWDDDKRNRVYEMMASAVPGDLPPQMGRAVEGFVGARLQGGGGTGEA